MTDEHERYERLVVGHVLGDLVAPEAGRFRSHLMSCQNCRSRVAELRGIAADLAEIERDERSRARVRTQMPRRLDEPEPGDEASPASRITVRHVTIATLVVVVLAALMGFWNLHLRTTAVTYLSVAEARGETLTGLASGIPLEPELGEGVGAAVATDGDTVSLALTRVEPLGEDESLIAWFLDGPEGETSAVVLGRTGQIEDETVTVTLDDPGARELVISRERGQPDDAPSDVQLLRVDLLGSG